MSYRFGYLLVIAMLTACASSRPASTSNVCSMFEERRSWFKAAERTEQRWNVPIPVAMAFIQQESSYQARARPERNRLLWVIPWRRPSSAFGYAQALDSTWEEYVQEVGGFMPRRSSFADAIDFIGWYNSNSYRRNNIARDDARNLYLAYHEGNAGFARRSWEGNSTLLATANQVQANASRYQAQLGQCRQELERSWWRRVLF
ncbi:MAG: hypothetical protein RQ757_07595 [Pseudomonadales bacterium]|nr:hypothetical protein [Pseudomonadales bacterium]